MAALKDKAQKIVLAFYTLLACICICGPAAAHSLPDCKADLQVQEDRVDILFRAPVELVELASKLQVNLASPEAVQQLKQYLLEHISVTDSLQSAWSISVDDLSIYEADDIAAGKYRQLVATVVLEPVLAGSLTSFDLHCDWVIHQVVNQSILFSLSQDWQNGIAADDANEIGVVSPDIATGKIAPLHVQRQGGSRSRGFYRMVSLGMEHIREGTDHLLFLLALLLPAPMLARGGKWQQFGGTRYSVKKLLQVVTAFTIGHSATLLVGSAGWLVLPSKPVEILIAVSILVSAVHAFRPVFPGREAVVAAGFGLVHGLAFASVLAGFHAGWVATALSIAGFNIGIEMMQLLVLCLVMPWLILLAKTPMYHWLQRAGAMVAGLAALGWMLERITGHGNVITKAINATDGYGAKGIAALAVFAFGSLLFFAVKNRRQKLRLLIRTVL